MKIKILNTFILFIILNFSLFAQTQKILFQGNYDYKKIHFGMALDFGAYNLYSDFNDNFFSNNNLLSVETKNDPCFGLSFLIPDLRINNNINYRHIITVKTIQRNIHYRFKDSQDIIQKVESWFLESGHYIKFRGDRINNSRIYIFSGPNFGIDMASEKDVKNQNIFKLNRLNVSLEIGFGYDFYFEYFKFAPQIKYSYGLRNLIVNDNTIYTNLINGFYSRGFQFSLTFE